MESWKEVNGTCRLSSRTAVLRDLRELSQRRRQRQRELKKGTVLISETTTLHVQHAISVHFLAVTAQLQTEMTSRNVLWRT